MAAASLGLVVAAGLASRLSTARTEGRDAVRVIGRRAIEVPGWREADAAAVWTPAALDWGPSFEPHRAPEGAVVGGRLALPPGAYAIEIAGEAVPSDLPPPSLLSGPDTGPVRHDALTRGPTALQGQFQVGWPGPTTLRLQEGSPFIVKEIRLEPASTFSGPAGLRR
jgi:hypothetical protein